MPSVSAIDPLTQTIPLWLLGLLLIAAGILALETGTWWGRRQLAVIRKKGIANPEKSDAQSHIIGSVFGLLAFLIGLTFSIALDRFDARRGWAAEEANAIGTAYLRAELFDEPNRSQLRSTLHEYTRARIVPDDLPQAEENLRYLKSEAIRDRLWRDTYDAVRPVRETSLAFYFVEAVNQALDVGTRRALAGASYIPTQILDVLLIYLIAASAMLGSQMGRDQKVFRFSSYMLVVLFSLSIILILNIDRPRSGSIKVSQRGLEELLTSMDANARSENTVTRAVTR